MAAPNIRPIGPGDRAWIAEFIQAQWHAEFVIVHGTIYRPADLPGYAAIDGEPIGLITYSIGNSFCEIVTLNSLRPNRGIGTALIEQVVKVARELKCQRVFVVTTNDNLKALGLYQKRGFRLVALAQDAVTSARKMKPEIPMMGENGIPIRDELELEMTMEEQSWAPTRPFGQIVCQ